MSTIYGIRQVIFPKIVCSDFNRSRYSRCLVLNINAYCLLLILTSQFLFLLFVLYYDMLCSFIIYTHMYIYSIYCIIYNITSKYAYIIYAFIYNIVCIVYIQTQWNSLLEYSPSQKLRLLLSWFNHNFFSDDFEHLSEFMWRMVQSLCFY